MNVFPCIVASYSKQQQYFFSNWMLDWCRNQQPTHEEATELTFIATNFVTQPQSSRNIIPPKFASSANQIRRLNPQSKKGIKTHFNQILKIDRQTQTILPEQTTKISKDCFTQTLEIILHPLNSKRNSLKDSQQQSSISKMHASNVLKVQIGKFDRMNFLQISKKMGYQSELNRMTKASYNLVESQDKAFKFDDKPYHHFKNVESYHLPQTYIKDSNQIQFSIQSARGMAIMKSKLPHKRCNNQQQEMVESVLNNTCYQYEENNVSQKYRKILKNVESEFKLSAQKNSQKKFKYTPDKRILFHERQTIISKYGESYNDEQNQMRVEQSLIYDRQIRSSFTLIGKPQMYENFILFLATENSSNLLISIKEISIKHMSQISEQLLIYRQLDQKRMITEGILQLYQTQIDGDAYLFIKQPYSQTLMSYIERVADLAPIEQMISSIFLGMEAKGFTLKILPKIQDFVVCFDEIKIQNLGILQLEANEKVEIYSALLALKQDILEHLL